MSEKDPYNFCGCGRPVRYMSPNDPSKGSCNKHGRCPSYEELQDACAFLNAQLRIYQKGVNQIDDYFEYARDSKQDQKKVYQILGNMTDQLLALSDGQLEKMKTD